MSLFAPGTYSPSTLTQTSAAPTDDFFGQYGGTADAPGFLAGDTPTAAPAPSGAPTGGGGDPYAIMRAAANGLPPTSGSIDAILTALRAQGIQAGRATHANNSLASDDVIVLPDGSEVDLISDVGGAGAAWGSFSKTGQYDPSRSIVGPDGKLTKFADFLSANKLPIPSYTPGQGGQGGQGAMLTPWSEAFDGGPGFKARSPEEIAQDPAYQFQLKEGLGGVQKSAAAKGTLLTGGTLKALDSYSQGLASTYNDKYYNRDVSEYDARYGRARSEYDLRRENYYNNQDRPFSKLFQTAGLGKPAA